MSTDAITEGLEDISLVQDNQPEVVEDETKDLALASLDSNAGWQQLRAHIEDRIKYHREMQGVDTASMSMEDVGKRFIVSDLVAAELEALLGKVDITVKEVTKRGRRPKK